MSNYALSAVWNHYPEGGSKLLIMTALADIGDDQGRGIWCGMEYLATKVRMSKRQVSRIIKELNDDGFIEVLDQNIPGRKINRDRYKLNIERVTNCPPLLNKSMTFGTKSMTPGVKKHDTKTPESEAASQNGPEPINPFNLKGDNPANSRITMLESYLLQIEKLPNKTEVEHKEINRVKAEIKELVKHG